MVLGLLLLNKFSTTFRKGATLHCNLMTKWCQNRQLLVNTNMPGLGNSIRVSSLNMPMGVFSGNTSHYTCGAYNIVESCVVLLWPQESRLSPSLGSIVSFQMSNSKHMSLSSLQPPQGTTRCVYARHLDWVSAWLLSSQSIHCPSVKRVFLETIK